MRIDKGRVGSILGQFDRHNILVVGDLMLDRYIYGNVRRISPEAPVPVVEAVREKTMPGGACNVASNIRALQAMAGVSGIVGADGDAGELRDLLEQSGVRVKGVMEVPEVRTTVKTRIMADRQQVIRLDWESPLTMAGGVLESLLERVADEIAGATGVIIEDYGKGVICQPLVDVVVDAAAKAGIPVGYDPKDDPELKVRGITVATPNRAEAYRAVGQPEPAQSPPPLEDESLLKVSEALLRKWDVQFLAITLGSQGMLIVSEGKEPHHIPTRAKEVFDVSGAGDTVIAACLLALAAGAEPAEAAELANRAAGVVVGKVGTATCSREELMRSFS